MSIATDSDVASRVQCGDYMINWGEKKIDPLFTNILNAVSFIRREDWRELTYFIPDLWFLLLTETYNFVLKVWILLLV